MYKKILAAVNEHLNSEISARYALRLAKVCKAKLYICFIAEKELPKASFNRAEEAIKRLFVEAENADIQVESITETGSAVEKITAVVKKENINLVFVSTRREDIQRRFYSGTIARKLSLALPCSVALVRIVNMGRIHPKKILAPLKGKSGHITEISHFAAMLAQAFGSSIHVFHVSKPRTKFFHGELHLTQLELEKNLPGDVLHFIEQLDSSRVEHEKKLLSGSAGRGITIEATANRHDLIIMGASERGLLSSVVKGNPVEQVLRDTPCDLIILKPRHEDK